MRSDLLKTTAAILVAALMLSACNESSDKAIRTADSSVTAAADTIKTAADTVIRKMDAAVQDGIDTVKSRLRATGDTLRKRIHK